MIVSSSGAITVVHNPTVDPDGEYGPDVNVDIDNTNYFKVAWDGGVYPTQSNSCGNNACQSYNGECVCDTAIEEVQVFNKLPSRSDILSQLNVGGVDVTVFASDYTLAASTGTVTVYHKNGVYDIDTVFMVEYFGQNVYLKNMLSTVNVVGTAYKFRNPVQFLNPALHEGRDAYYETEAVLEYFAQHPNVAPFIAHKMIQRLGTSNPSPGYIEAAAVAFTTGSYTAGGQTFGDGRYGSLEALVAAIILEEVRTKRKSIKKHFQFM